MIPKRGLFTLSADPIHWGHLEIIRCAAKMCDNLVVAVMANPDKPDHVLKPEEQLNTAIRACRDWCPSNITVMQAEGLLVDLFMKFGCDMVYRGIRNAADREYEQTQIRYYEMMHPNFGDHVMLLEAPNFSHIQSTVIRSFTANYLPVSSMVPVSVAARLSRKVHRQKFVGLADYTSEEAEELIQLLGSTGFPCHVVHLKELMSNLEQAKDVGTKNFAEALKRYQSLEGNEIPGIMQAEYAAHLSRFFREWLRDNHQGVVLVAEAEILMRLNKLDWIHNNLVTRTQEMADNAKLLADKAKYGTVIKFDPECDRPLDLGGTDSPLSKLAEKLSDAIRASVI